MYSTLILVLKAHFSLFFFKRMLISFHRVAASNYSHFLNAVTTRNEMIASTNIGYWQLWRIKPENLIRCNYQLKGLCATWIFFSDM